jgi:surface protein
MGWTFYGLKAVTLLDTSNFDTSNVKSMHHMFAHCSKLKLVGYENWDVSNCTTFNALFHSIANKTMDLRKWDTSNCESFSQMFEHMSNLKAIYGLETFKTSKGKNFEEMFKGCIRLTELDLSSFDTRNASDTWIDNQRGYNSEKGMRNMFSEMNSLQIVKLGENFMFDGNPNECEIAAVLPTPASGYWYTTDGTEYKAEELPNGLGTYYSVKPQ